MDCECCNNIRDAKTTVHSICVFNSQDGTVGDENGRSLAMADDGSFVIAGESSGNFTGIEAIGVGSDSNFAAIKLDSEGAEVWRWQVRRWSSVIVVRYRKTRATA